MKKACEALQEKRLISDLSISVRVERTSDWSRNWERKVSGASLVMIHLMKNALKSSFWKDCKNFLDQNHIAYFVDAIDGDMAEHSASIDGDVLETFRKYCLYGGLSNFKNLWLYANGLFDNKAEKAAPPHTLRRPPRRIKAVAARPSARQAAPRRTITDNRAEN